MQVKTPRHPIKDVLIKIVDYQTEVSNTLHHYRILVC